MPTMHDYRCDASSDLTCMIKGSFEAMLSVIHGVMHFARVEAMYICMRIPCRGVGITIRRSQVAVRSSHRAACCTFRRGYARD